jgi:hypothetical protein
VRFRQDGEDYDKAMQINPELFEAQGRQENADTVRSWLEELE